jgi:hypothetical protein
MSNYTYHGTTDLVALPQRNVQTFPSGLVRVDRVYACRKALADRFRRDLAVGNPLPLDPGTPAIDGLYIFPEPQENVRGDGFSEFRVSAYGRTSTSGVGSLNAEVISISRNYSRDIGATEEPDVISWSLSEEWIVDTWVETFAIPSTASNADIEIPAVTLNRRRLSFRITGQTPGLIFGIPIIWTTTLTGVTRTAYGAFDEIVTSFRSVPSDNPNSFLYRDLV